VETDRETGEWRQIERKAAEEREDRRGEGGERGGASNGRGKVERERVGTVWEC